MEAFPLLLHKAPVAILTGLQSIIQSKLSDGAPGTVAVIRPFQTPLIAPTVLLISGGETGI
jgi:hypothetical protein